MLLGEQPGGDSLAVRRSGVPWAEVLDGLLNAVGVVPQRSLGPVTDVTLGLIEPEVDGDVVIRLTAEAERR